MEYFDLWDSCMIKSLRLPKSGNQLRLLIHRVPSGRISNTLSIPRKFSALEITSSGWPFVSAVLGQMAHLVASITLDSARSYVMQSGFLTRTVSSATHDFQLVSADKALKVSIFLFCYGW
ncbi:hypothetical protein Tco_1067100 [Tanacetum coccineum]|uniref:Uncharacterized protein n=1 Tax=Tanacetum coccineum TaxID=301880 RepID=A0ABQ5HBV9_9ASTR